MESSTSHLPDRAVAARLVLETLVFWAVHRHWDPGPSAGGRRGRAGHRQRVPSGSPREGQVPVSCQRGVPRELLERHYGTCGESARIEAPRARPWDTDLPVYVCREPSGTMAELWPEVRRLGTAPLAPRPVGAAKHPARSERVEPARLRPLREIRSVENMFELGERHRGPSTPQRTHARRAGHRAGARARPPRRARRAGS